MSPKDALAITMSEINENKNLRIVAISGPGEPLANPETFRTLQLIREEFSDIAICLSTNGTLLEENIELLKDIDVKTISVSMSTANPSSASKIYEWAYLDDELLQDECVGPRIIKSQLRGITKAANQGINVKVNSILIPDINKWDIIPLAREISKAGAVLQNIVPLIPNDTLASSRAPTSMELQQARQAASIYINQFTHCKQCRSDVVGIPGNDRIL
jgi:nitrogen fixation protein NifB